MGLPAPADRGAGGITLVHEPHTRGGVVAATPRIETPHRHELGRYASQAPTPTGAINQTYIVSRCGRTSLRSGTWMAADQGVGRALPPTTKTPNEHASAAAPVTTSARTRGALQVRR